MANDDTTPRTLWTETLMEMLMSALGKPNDDAVRGILKEIRAKGIRKSEVMSFIERRAPQHRARIKQLIQAMGTPGRRSA